MASTPNYSTLAAWPLAICRTLNSENIDPSPLLSGAGLNYSEFEANPDGRIPISNMTQFWQKVETASKNPAFALKVGQFVQPMHFRALGLLMITSKNMLEAMESLEKYHALVSNTVDIRIIKKVDRIGFVIDPLPGVPIHPMSIDAFFATLVILSQQLTDQQDLLLAVELIREQPEQPRPWQTFFKCPVGFQRASNCLWLNKDTLLKSRIMGDAQLAASNEVAVQNYLNKMDALSWQEKIKQSIQAELSSHKGQGEPKLSQIAERFNLSERTLRRYLNEENCNFRQILQDTRMELAEYYLDKTEENITDIALQLGFTETGNFTRAFQRWFGHSPSQHREKE